MSVILLSERHGDFDDHARTEATVARKECQRSEKTLTLYGGCLGMTIKVGRAFTMAIIFTKRVLAKNA